MTDTQITLNGTRMDCSSNATLMEVCENNGTYVPHLCHHKGLSPHGSCRLCIVKVNGQVRPACITPVSAHAIVETEDAELHQLRLRLTQLLFTEGNHYCPSCELSGNCQLQAMGYHLGMLDSHFPHAYPHRELDGSHESIVLDRDRCINCALCVRASHTLDNKDVFRLIGRGPSTAIAVNADSNQMKDTPLEEQDKACHICPTGALLLRNKPYSHPIGSRLFDNLDIGERGNLRIESLDEGQDAAMPTDAAQPGNGTI